MKSLMILIAILSYISGLCGIVYYKTETNLPSYVQGKKDQWIQHPDYCAAYWAQYSGAVVYQCQIPAWFEECSDYGVMTNLDYPHCCWVCTYWVYC